MSVYSFGQYYQPLNVKASLDTNDVVQIEERCRTRAVESDYFRSRLVEDFTLSVASGMLTVTLQFADGSNKTKTVALS